MITLGVLLYMMAAAAFRCFFSSYLSFEVMALTINYLLILTEYTFYFIVQLYLLHNWDAPSELIDQLLPTQIH
jgi:hypothetical protein